MLTIKSPVRVIVKRNATDKPMKYYTFTTACSCV